MNKTAKHSLEEKIKLRNKKEKRQRIISQTKKVIDTLSKLSATLLLVREKPKAMDYFSIACTLANIGIKVQEEFSAINEENLQAYFDPSIHYRIPYTLAKTSINLCAEKTIIIQNTKNKLVKGTIYNTDIDVFWTEGKSDTDGAALDPYCDKENKDILVDKIGDILWQEMDSEHLILEKGGQLIPYKEELDFQPIETNGIISLENRIRKFLNKNIVRSYLLEGPPGTGKTSGIIYLVQKLGLRSIRLNPAHLYKGKWDDKEEITDNLEILLNVLKPDAIVMDDIDRAYLGTGDYLRIFEILRKYCKVILATCNNKNSIIGAVLRVGRFDDHIEIRYLEKEVVSKMLEPDDQDLVPRFVKWPIAYIQNYKTIKSVIGKEEARAELNDLEERIFDIERKTKHENGGDGWKLPSSILQKLTEQTTNKEEKKKEESTPIESKEPEPVQTTEEVSETIMHKAPCNMCPICGMLLVPGKSVNKHHLVPKLKGGKQAESIHVICHGKIHSLWSENELKNTYNNWETIKKHPDMQTFIVWVRKQFERDAEFVDSNKLSSSNNKRRRHK